MKTEIGDYIEHTWDEHYGVVVKVIDLPFGGHEYLVASMYTGEIERVEDANFVANFDRTKSRRHHWTEGQQEEYDHLPVEGRRLYDNLRTRLSLDHVTAYLLCLEYIG